MITRKSERGTLVDQRSKFGYVCTWHEHGKEVAFTRIDMLETPADFDEDTLRKSLPIFILFKC